MEAFKNLLKVRELSQSFKYYNEETNEKKKNVDLDEDCTENIDNKMVVCKYTSILLLLTGGVYISSEIYKKCIRG